MFKQYTEISVSSLNCKPRVLLYFTFYFVLFKPRILFPVVQNYRNSVMPVMGAPTILNHPGLPSLSLSSFSLEGVVSTIKAQVCCVVKQYIVSGYDKCSDEHDEMVTFTDLYE